MTQNVTGNTSQFDIDSAYTIPASAIRSLIALLGLFGNAMIIYVTLIQRYLKSVSSVLIGILALFDLVSCIGAFQVICIVFIALQIQIEIQQVIIDVVPLYNMLHETCFYYDLPYVFCLSSGAAMIAMVGLDRVLALVVPLQ